MKLRDSDFKLPNPEHCRLLADKTADGRFFSVSPSLSETMISNKQMNQDKTKENLDLLEVEKIEAREVPGEGQGEDDQWVPFHRQKE